MDKESLLPSNNENDSSSFWHNYQILRQKRSKRRRGCCSATTCCLVLTMSVLVSVATFFAYSRLADSLLHKYSPLESLNLAFNQDQCMENGTHCRPQLNLINTQRYMAPLGAYLMLFSFVLAIILVFSFVFLPLGSDKIQLRKSLYCWLAIDLFFIVVVAILSVVGAVLVILHDKDSSVIKDRPVWQKILWDLALLSSPFLVLVFHVCFWRRVCVVYQSIDTSKEAIKDVWSSKI